MSREIEFRAWSNEHNRYCDFVTLDENGKWIGWIKSNGVYLTTVDIILEQYTGLKDKYGEKIYEGDVVALMYGYIPVKAYEKDQIKIDSAQKAVVRYGDKKAAFRYTIIKQGKDCQFKFRANESMVVIGNCHENPELLGGKK